MTTAAHAAATKAARGKRPPPNSATALPLRRPLAEGWSEPAPRQPATLPSCHRSGTVGP